MKITGSHKHDATTDGLIEMDSIAIAANSSALRYIAKFLNDAANEMDKLGNDFDHIHLMDLWPQWQDNFPDIQVLSEKYS